MNPSTRALGTALLILAWRTADAHGQVSAGIAVESRVFGGSVAGEHASVETSLGFRMRYQLHWDRRRQVISLEGFARVGLANSQRTHVDIRELTWRKRWRSWELVAGMGIVSWGELESAGIVDVINQQDLIEGLHVHAKLGQPMMSVAWLRPWGTIEALVLPWFRERAFKGREARLQSPLAVVPDTAVYASGTGRHPGLAVRWTQAFGAVDVGVAVFDGIDRDPRFQPFAHEGAVTGLVPVYHRVRRLGLNGRWMTGRWIWKVETTLRRGQSAAGVGVEYVPASFLSLLAEYLYDSRGAQATTLFESDLFLGAQLRWLDGDARLGAYVDRSSGDLLITGEAAHRLRRNWTVAVGGSWRGGSSAGESPYAPRWTNRLSLTVRHLY